MRTVTALLLSVLAVGCGDNDDDDDIDIDVDGDGIPDNQDGDGDDMPTETTFEWQANLSGTGDPYSTLSGNSIVRQTEGQPVFTATITLRGDFPAGAVRPWHVHFGTCGTGGAIVGPPESYPPLTIGGDGFAMTDARVEFQLDTAAPYHVNVHVSPSDLPTIIACGDLVMQ